MCCKPQKGLTTVIGVTTTATEEGVILVKVVVLFVIMVVIVVAVTELLLGATAAAVGIVASAVMATETDGATLNVAELALLFELTLLSDGKGGTTVVLTFAVVGAVTTSTAARREQTNGTSIVARTTTLLLIIRRRELDFSADGIEIRKATNGRKVLGIDVVPQLGAVARDLLHDDRVAELGQQAVDALNRGVGHLTLLQGTVHVPFLSNTTLNEVCDELGTNEVDEGVSNIEVVREINAEVGEVVMTLQSVVGEELDLPETSEDLTQPLNR